MVLLRVVANILNNVFLSVPMWERVAIVAKRLTSTIRLPEENLWLDLSEIPRSAKVVHNGSNGYRSRRDFEKSISRKWSYGNRVSQPVTLVSLPTNGLPMSICQTDVAKSRPRYWKYSCPKRQCVQMLRLCTRFALVFQVIVFGASNWMHVTCRSCILMAQRWKLARTMYNVREDFYGPSLIIEHVLSRGTAAFSRIQNGGYSCT